MLEALTASHYLDGLRRRLQVQWGGSLPSSEVDECVAEAVDAACAAVFAGRRISSLGAWLWKAAGQHCEQQVEAGLLSPTGIRLCRLGVRR